MSQAGLIDIESANPQIATSYTTDSGTAIPIANNLEILGGEGIDTSASGKTVTISGENATAGPNLAGANKGIAAFDEEMFDVVDGFVTLVSGVGAGSFLTDDGAPAVEPDEDGVIQILGGDGINVTGQGPGNVITVTADGAITSVLTSNATPQFSLVGSVSTVDFGLSNLVMGTSLPALTSGTQNVGLGNGVFSTLTTGIGNTSVGTNSSDAITSGQNNVSVGYNSLTSATIGVQNTAIGTSSLQLLSTSNGHNTAVGYTSLFALTTGTYNIGLGVNAGGAYTSSESSNICIGNDGTIADSHAIRIGTQGSSDGQQTSCYIAGITGVTVSNPVLVTLNSSTGQLGNVASGNNGVLITSNTGVPSLLANSGTPGYVLTANAGAPPSWQTLPAGGVTSITGTANQVLANGTSGSAQTGAVTLTTPQDIATTSSPTFANVTLSTGGALRTGTGVGNTLRLQGYDTDTGPAYTTFLTITAGTAPEMLITNSLGAFGSPSYTFVGDTNTGMFSPGSDNIALMVGGAYALLADTTNTNIYKILRTQSGVAWTYQGTAIDLTVTTAMYVIGVTSTAATRTITLPNAANSGTSFIIKDESGAAATNPINVTVSGGVKTIDGLTTQTISSNYGSMTVYYNGTNYFII